ALDDNTFTRRIAPSGEVAMQSVNVPPVSTQICQRADIICRAGTSWHRGRSRLRGEALVQALHPIVFGLDRARLLQPLPRLVEIAFGERPLPHRGIRLGVLAVEAERAAVEPPRLVESPARQGKI